MDLSASEFTDSAATVVRCPVPVSTRAPGGHTNAYVVGRDPAVLVDPANRTDALDRAVRRRGVEHVLLTHTHPDHLGAVGAYANEADATVWVPRGYAARFCDATGLEPDRRFVTGATITVGRDDDALEGGDGDRGGSSELAVQLLDAPGHAPEHVAIRVGRDGPICCGDCAVLEGSVVVGAPEGDMRAYLSTLRRLRAMDPPRLFPGHGPEIDDPRTTLERLIAHRLARERRVLAAVDSGAETLEDVLDAAYDKDIAGVRELASATVAAHLEKLAVERRVAWDGERARLVGGGD